MSYWNYNTVYGATIVLWGLSIGTAFLTKRRLFLILNHLFIALGLLLLATFIVSLWVDLDRAPLKNLGETRLWYAFLLPLSALVIHLRLKLKWLLHYALAMAILFLTISLLNPDSFDNTLAPALQSIWFVPHVIVYMIAYALLAATFLFAVRGLYLIHFRKTEPVHTLLQHTDMVLYAGFSFLTIGLLLGAIWAKEAWGHYWTWDPKETWALLTWLMYLIYIHLRYRYKTEFRLAFWFLGLSFVILLFCWFGINYLPAASSSVHAYSYS